MTREHKPIHPIGLENLKAAVVHRACDDYLTAGPGGRAAIIRWIRSDEFLLWSDLDPETLIEQLQKIKRKLRQ